jgi:hypothetical protein
MGVGGDPAVAELVQKVVLEEVGDMRVKMRPLYAEVYAKTYSDQELTDLLSFYRSASGRAMVAKAPGLIQQSQLAIAPLLPEMQRDMVVKIFDQLCSVKSCTQLMRKQLMAAKQAALDRLNAQQAATAAVESAMPH